jgi:hypothetical protein
MRKILILISITTWVLYNYSALKLNTKYKKDKVHSIFKLLPINNMFLYAILLYFLIYYEKASNIFLVSILLFSSIHLFLFFNNLTKSHVEKQKIHVSTFIITTLIPIIMYIFEWNYKYIFYVMIWISFFIYYIEVLIRKVFKK